MSDKDLAYVSKISSLDQIEGKDRIVLASFENNDWKVIVSKTDFIVGDYCIYIETGSILPIKPEFQFLEKRCYSPKYKGYKIKTMKMGEAYSEGIAFTFKQLSLPEDHEIDKNYTDILGIRRIEDDVPDIKHQVKKPKIQRFIEKWLYKIFKIKMVKKGFFVSDFPTDLIPKTDETQVQSLSYVFNELQGMPIYASIKIDGQSGTFLLNKNKFSISSRNRTVYSAPIKKAIREINERKAKKYLDYSAHAYVAALYNLPIKLQQLAKDLNIENIAIQGEVAGPSIQKNRLGLQDFNLFIFSVYDVNARRFFTLSTLEHVAKSLKIVPIIYSVNKFEWKNIDELTKWTEQFKYTNDFPAEGVVIRANPKDEIYMPYAMHKMNAMLSLKCINPLFKLKTQDSE
jgi:hypothetical protein